MSRRDGSGGDGELRNAVKRVVSSCQDLVYGFLLLACSRFLGLCGETGDVQLCPACL
jgi:hypothetical protein